MQRQCLRRKLRTPRAAFSLIEMLMVIGIVGLLMTIAVLAIGHTLAGARETATDATIKKIHGLLQDRMQAFERMDFHTEVTALQRARPDLDKRQCEMLVRKWKFKQLFPQNRQDLQQDSTQTFIRGLSPDLQQELEDLNFVTGTPKDTDSAVLLYLALTQSSVLGSSPVDQDHFSSQEVKKNDDGLNMFVDAWGNPLRFYRWPTRLIRPDGTSGPNDPIPAISDGNKARAEMLLPRMPREELAKDPDNPQGYQPQGLGSTVIGAFDEANYHTADTYHTPLIVSAGRDEVLGLREPHDVSNWGHLARPLADTADMDNALNNALTDNISNYRRVGGGN
jgi:prepilin-type N-terminal cleavage/methylation domain-containing protein